jgi:hypothetical protein
VRENFGAGSQGVELTTGSHLPLAASYSSSLPSSSSNLQVFVSFEKYIRSSFANSAACAVAEEPAAAEGNDDISPQALFTSVEN